jgi:allantoinase
LNRVDNSTSFILRSGRVVTPEGVRDAAIVVFEGVIVGIENPRDISVNGKLKIEDVGNFVVSPGLVDPHVHINEPGRTEWEGFETATRAAAAGGVTTLVDMPLNSSPVTTSVDAFQKKLDAARGKLQVDVGFHAGLVPQNASELKPLLSSGVLGVKAFTIHSGIDDFPATTEADFRKAMSAIAESGLPLLVHAELSSSLPSQALSEAKSLSALRSGDTLPARLTSASEAGGRSAQGFVNSRPREWENDAIALMIRLCKEYRCRVHIVHVSSSDAILLLRDAKAAGLPITAETCPHYLYFNAEEISDGDTRFKCAPPIRERDNNERLWDALRQGVLDFIASDHSPCPPAMKLLSKGDFTKAWGGISSLQFGLSIIWTEARKRGFVYSDLSRWMSANPAQLVGLESRKGKITEGFDADFVVWNPDESFVVEPSMIHHRHKLTPYEGRTLFGKVYATYLRGEKIFVHGKFLQPSGEVLLRTKT